VSPDDLRERLRRAVEGGDIEVITARAEEDGGGELVGVAVVAYRPSVSAGGLFASVEELQVKQGARRRGVGRALLEAVGERCSVRGVSYVEVQTDAEAETFYATAGFEREPEVRVMSRTYPWAASRGTGYRP
jgi:GNAT superfamily N-acetyltransferase